MRGRCPVRAAAVLTGMALVVGLSAGPAAAGTWAASLAAGSGSEAAAVATPVAPAQAHATCASLVAISSPVVVSWSAVAGDIAYAVYQAPSVGGSWSRVTQTTSTTASVPSPGPGSWRFEVAAVAGTWSSANRSTPTGTVVVAANLLCAGGG